MASLWKERAALLQQLKVQSSSPFDMWRACAYGPLAEMYECLAVTTNAPQPAAELASASFHFSPGHTGLLQSQAELLESAQRSSVRTGQTLAALHDKVTVAVSTEINADASTGEAQSPESNKVRVLAIVPACIDNIAAAPSASSSLDCSLAGLASKRFLAGRSGWFQQHGACCPSKSVRSSSTKRHGRSASKMQVAWRQLHRTADSRHAATGGYLWHCSKRVRGR